MLDLLYLISHSCYNFSIALQMKYRIEKKSAFKVMGVSRMFSYESANTDIPKYWDEIHARAEVRPVKGMYGICFDEEMAGNQFRYMIADDLQTEDAAKKHLEEYEVPEHTWAIFPCTGPMRVFDTSV